MSDGEIKSSSSSDTNSDSESTSSSSSNESNSVSGNESFENQQCTTITNQIPPVDSLDANVQEPAEEERSNTLQSDATESTVEIVTENVENPKESIANVADSKPQEIEFVNNENPKIVDASPKRHIHSENSGPKAKKMKSCAREKSLSPPPKQVQRKDRRSSRSPKRNTQDDNKGRKEKPAGITERQRRTVDLLTSRTGGAYIPPAKLRMLQAEITDKSSMAYQRIAWEALKKSIHGYINKVNVDNIGIITRELLKENIVRGSGLLCRSIIQAQAASPTFTHVYAALVAIINSKFPKIGELLLQRLVIQFKRGFRRNDKGVCISSSRFIAHLVNQRVAHEILALQILTLLVESPTDDSVEVAIAFLKECGMKLTEVSSKGVNAIFEMLKNILHEGKLDKRVQYMIEVVFQVRKDGFKDHQSVIEALELVEEEDQFTHLINLDETTDPQDVLNVFKFDEKYETNEDKYKGLSKELLGSDISDSDGGSSDSDSDESGDEGDGGKEKGDVIIDNTETNLVALRRTIYLTIHSSLDYEECAHKLMKMQLKPGQEMELCHMFLDCCAEQRTYEKFYGLLAQRFCMINKVYVPPFEDIFRDTYHTTHRLDTNRLRNVSKFFAHLLFTDAIGWDVFECMKLNEEDTTSSSRIFIKILFQELAEYMGLGKLNDRLKDQTLSESFAGLFPRDNPRNTRFAINFFTSIGLGGLTDELREFLKTAPRVIPAVNQDVTLLSNSSSSTSSESSSDSSSSTSSESSSSSSSDSSGSDKKKMKKKSTSKRRKKKSASSSGSGEEDTKEASKRKKIKKKQTSRNLENEKPSAAKDKKKVVRQEARDSMKQSEKRKRNKSPETENHSMKRKERRASPRSNSFQRERVRDNDEKYNVSGKLADNRQKDDRDRYEYKNRSDDQIKQNDRRREDDDRESKCKPVSDRRQEDYGKQLSTRRRDDRYRDNDRKYESERRQEDRRHRDEYKRKSDQMRGEKRTRHDSES